MSVSLSRQMTFFCKQHERLSLQGKGGVFAAKWEMNFRIVHRRISRSEYWLLQLSKQNTFRPINKSDASNQYVWNSVKRIENQSHVISCNLSVFIGCSVCVSTERVQTPLSALLHLLQCNVACKFQSDNMQVNEMFPYGIPLFPENHYDVTQLLSLALFRYSALI